MATTLERNIGLVDAAAAALQNDRINVQAGWSHPTLPQRYAFREIDFYIDGNGHLQFCFRNTGLAQPLNGLTIEQVASSYRAAPRPEPEFLLATTFDEPPQTPLDLQAWGDPIYIVYRLFGPRNMTFNARLKAVSHKNADAQDRYGLLRHFGPTGGGSIEPVADCELIYFACVPKNVDPYRDRFNLNVVLEQTPILTTGGEVEVERAIELEIDPDIRFPGGSST